MPMQLLDSDSRKVSTSSEWWNRRTNLEQRLVLGGGVLLIFNLAFIITIAVLANQSPSNNNDCKSERRPGESLQLQQNSVVSADSRPRRPTTKVTTTKTTVTTNLPDTTYIPLCIPNDSTSPESTTTGIPSTTIISSTPNIEIINLDNSLTSFLQPKEETCITGGCAAAACSISSSLNLNVDPCTDFYEYACGGWILTNVQPNASDSINRDVAMTHKVILAKDVLNQPVSPNEHVYKANVINFYRGCMNLPAINDSGIQPLMEYLSKYSVWAYENLWNPSKFNWVDAIAELDFDVLMWVEIKPDPEHELQNIIYLQPGSLGDFWTPQESSHTLAHAAAYMNYMLDIVGALGANATRKDMQNVAVFEARLANITLEPDGKNIRNDPLYNRTTIRALMDSIPGVDWLGFFQKVFPKDLQISENEEIMVNHFEYFPAMVSLISEISSQTPKVIPNYILVRIAMTYAFDLSYKFQNAYNDFMQSVFNVNFEDLRWKFCLDLTIKEFPNSVGALYVAKYFPKEAFQLSQDIFQNVTNQYKKVILESSWLDEKTKQDARAKIDGLVIRAIIGYIPNALSESFLNAAHSGINRMESNTHFQNKVHLRHNDRDLYLKSLREKIALNVATGGASDDSPMYNVEQNRLNLYAGALTRPKFDKDFPKSFNYAGIGSEIAYLVTLGLDEIGREYDSRGMKSEWGLNSTYEKFIEKANCFVDQFNQYPIPELGLNVNGTRTKQSNVAETTALKVAYKAFMESNTNNKDLPLPGLQNYTSEQLFFLNFAQMYCGGTNVYSQKRTLNLDQSPDQYRVNGVVSNFPEFSKVFKCPANSPMNPTKKCSIWE